MLDVRNKSKKEINSIIAQTKKEIEYWQNVLRHVVSVIKLLVSRLPFRSNNERFGSLQSGNYMI